MAIPRIVLDGNPVFRTVRRALHGIRKYWAAGDVAFGTTCAADIRPGAERDSSGGSMPLSWIPLGGIAPFKTFGGAQHLVVKYCAAARDISIEPIDDTVFQLRYGGGSIFFAKHMPDTTSFVAREISDSKHLTKKMLYRAGLEAPQGRVFAGEEFQRAWEYAQVLGLPVVVKPLAGSGGNGVTPNVACKEDFRRAWHRLKPGRSRIVERHVAGQDYRLLVVGGRVACAALRTPAAVTGDGVSTIVDLVAAKNRARAHNPYAGRKPIKIDEVITHNLVAVGLSPDSILDAGQTVALHRIANVGAGGDSRDVSDQVHSGFAEIAVRACHAIPGILHAGIDLLAADIARPPSAQSYSICEVNTRPDLSLHHFPIYGHARDAAGALLEALFPGASVLPRESWKSVSLTLSGKVIGVGMRKRLHTKCNLASIAGWVQNCGDGTVRAAFTGPPSAVDRVLRELAALPKVRVCSALAADECYEGFTILS